jgi:hypothetical protein
MVSPSQSEDFLLALKQAEFYVRTAPVPGAPHFWMGMPIAERSYVLPWSQFLYAEGGDDEVRLAFTTHDVLVNGSQLGSLAQLWRVVRR